MPSENTLTRRDFLKLGIAAGYTMALGGGCSSSSPHLTGTGRYEFRGFNVHPSPLKNL